MLAAVFNRDVSKESLLRYPEMYRSGQSNEHFNLRLLGWNIFDAIFVSLVVFFASAYDFNLPSSTDGTINDLWTCSTAMFSWVVVLVNIRVALDTTTFTWLTWLFLFVSLACWYLFAVVYSLLWITPDMWGVGERLLAMPKFWLYQFFIPIVCIIPILVVRYWRRNYMPSNVDIVAERDNNHLWDEVAAESPAGRSGAFSLARSLPGDSFGGVTVRVSAVQVPSEGRASAPPGERKLEPVLKERESLSRGSSDVAGGGGARDPAVGAAFDYLPLPTPSPLPSETISEGASATERKSKTQR